LEPKKRQSNLPDPARQVAILVTGAHFRAAYEIYAHVAVAEHDKLPDAKLATIVAGQRPPDLTRDEAVAYDVAAALTGGPGADLSRCGRGVLRCFVIDLSQDSILSVIDRLSCPELDMILAC
jgi:alkylhydroperoxidase family enzyme